MEGGNLGVGCIQEQTLEQIIMSTVSRSPFGRK